MKKCYIIAAELMETMMIQINDIKLVVNMADDICLEVKAALENCKSLLSFTKEKCEELAALAKDE